MRALFDRMTRSADRTRSRSCRPRFERMEERTLLSPVTWTGAAGNNDWDTPDNWSTDSVPGSMDDVTINIPADITHASNTADSIWARS